MGSDSPIHTLKQLEGRRVAFPSPDAFVGYAVPALAIKEAGVRVAGLIETFARVAAAETAAPLRVVSH